MQSKSIARFSRLVSHHSSRQNPESCAVLQSRAEPRRLRSVGHESIVTGYKRGSNGRIAKDRFIALVEGRLMVKSQLARLLYSYYMSARQRPAMLGNCSIVSALQRPEGLPT